MCKVLNTYHIGLGISDPEALQPNNEKILISNPINKPNAKFLPSKL